MAQQVLTPRDYFSDRTLGDTYVQAMQIKGARSQMADAEARRAQEPQNQRMRDMKEVDSAWKLIADITREQGVEGGNALAQELYNESPAFQQFHPGGAPEVKKHDAKKGYHVAQVTLNQDRKDSQGGIVKAGELAYIAVADSGELIGVIGKVPQKEEKPDKPAMSEKQAVDGYDSTLKALHVLDSNPMSYSGDPAAYRESLKHKIEYYKQFLPEGYAAKMGVGGGQDEGMKGAGTVVRTGVDKTTGKRVVQYGDGTIALE